jgi:hypothetical protein
MDCVLDRAAGVNSLCAGCAQNFFEVQQQQGIILYNQKAHASQGAAAGIRRVRHPFAPCKQVRLCR